jgi:hypothetical protein
MSAVATMSAASGFVPAMMTFMSTSVPSVRPLPSIADEPSITARPVRLARTMSTIS